MKELFKKYVTIPNVIGVIACIAFPPLILGIVMQQFDNVSKPSGVSCSAWVNNQSNSGSDSII